MYRLRTKGAKRDPIKQWNLPDRDRRVVPADFPHATQIS